MPHRRACRIGPKVRYFWVSGRLSIGRMEICDTKIEAATPILDHAAPVVVTGQKWDSYGFCRRRRSEGLRVLRFRSFCGVVCIRRAAIRIARSLI